MSLPRDGALAQRFDVRRKIGKGGFAVVYEAVDRRTGQLVALKVLEPDAGTRYAPSTRGRFEREVAILSQLESPHTLRLLDHGEADERLFAVFELLGGRDLSVLLRQQGVLTPDETRHVLQQLLHALGEAHATGLLHRDLKPENIRVFPTEHDPLHIKLMDFGLARSFGDSHITGTGELIGTPRYMSPEQLRGADLTPASDIYSLGLIAFELLLGRDALHGNRWSDQLDRIRTGHLFSAPQLEHLGPLLQTLQRMTAPRPADRFASTRQVLEALAGRPVSAASPTRPTSPSIPTGRILLAVGVACLIVLAFFRGDPAPPQRSQVEIPAPLRSARTIQQAPSPPDVGLAAELHAADAGSATYAARVDAKPSAGCGEMGHVGDLVMHPPIHATADVALPLVILLHSDYNSPQDTLELSGLKDVADEEGFYVAAPEGRRDLTLAWAPQAWRDSELPIVEAYETVRAARCIDEHRVFIVALGDGGRKIHKFYNRAWVRAVVVASYLENHGFTSRPTPVAAMFLLPAESVRLPLDGTEPCGSGSRNWTLDRLVETWTQVNGCRREPGDDDRPGCRTWMCERPLRICEIPGGIGWPGMNRDPVSTGCGEAENDRSWPYAQVTWEFLSSSPARSR